MLQNSRTREFTLAKVLIYVRRPKIHRHRRFWCNKLVSDIVVPKKRLRRVSQKRCEYAIQKQRYDELNEKREEGREEGGGGKRERTRSTPGFESNNLHSSPLLSYFQLNWPATYIVREVARDGDASDNAAGVAGRADNTPAGIAATGGASERDWLVSPGRIADSYGPSYPPPSVDPLSWR